MIVSNERNIILDEELNLFDEDDWDFLSVPAGSRNFSYFEEVPDKSYITEDSKLFKFLMYVVLVVLVCILVSFVGIIAYTKFFMYDLSSSADVDSAISEIPSAGIEHIDAEQVSSDELIKVSSVFNNYFQVLGNEQGYSDMNNMFVSGSNFASLEEKYRTGAESSYDTDDCYARALREFGGYIELDNITDVRVSDAGDYYCYVMLTVPDTDNFYEYFIKYSYEMTKKFGASRLDYVNVTKFLLSATANNDVPTKKQEFLFKVKKTGDSYLIVDDSQITSICTDSYNSSISNITSILGGNLANTQYK